MAGTSEDPVNTGTGNFYRDETDLSVSSRGTVILCGRAYNSQAAASVRGMDRTETPLGPGWTHSYYIWLEPDAPDGQVGVHYGDGHADYWMAAPPIDRDIDGTSTTTWNYPLSRSNHDARTTSIYLASELNCDAGSIQAMRYYVSTVPGAVMNTFTIRMRHTTASTYADGTFENDNWTTVYQTNQTISGTGWYTFTFTTPFVWDGVQNLEVDVCFNNSTTSTDGQVYYFAGTGNRTKYYRCNSCTCGTTNPLTWTCAGNLTSNVPRTAFVIAEQGHYVMSVPGVYDTLVHNSNGSWTMRRTNEDVHQFDADGRLLSITDKNANVTSFSYTNPGFPEYATAVTDPVGRSVVLEYIDLDPDPVEELWRLWKVTDWTGRYVEYTYPDGYLMDVRDVMGEHITYTYDENGYLATVTDLRGVTTVTNTYDENGRVLSQLDADGNETAFTYGARGRAATTSFTRQVTVEGEPEPRTLTWVHPHEERYKRQLEHEDPLGTPVQYGYDGMFNRNRIIDRNGRITAFAYDPKGNVTSATEADDPNDPHDGGVTIVEYPDPNNPNHPPCPHVPISKTDALSYVTEWEYDNNCNVIGERRYLDPQRTQYVEKSWTYNSFGQRTSETDERGNVHEWVYDANGLLIEERQWDYADPNNPVLVSRTWYGYDDLWRRIWVTDGRGSGSQDPAYTTRYFYDAADRLVRIEGPPVGDPPHSIVRTFGYDQIGNRTSVTDGNGNTTTYVCDNNSNLIRIEEPEGRRTWYVYDELNRKVRMYDANNDPNQPGSVYTWYVYDDGGRLIEQHDPAGNVWTYEYDAQGNLTREEDGAGVWTEHEYDALNRRVLTRNAAGETRFEYDKLGRLTRQIDATGKETNFTYDGLGRLVCVVDAAGGWTEYRYDAAGNLVEIEDARNQVVSRRRYDALNRLIYAEDGNGNFYQYGYDAVGNQIWVIDANGRRTDLTYDAENRLVQISYPDGTYVLYEYDDNGNRVGMVNSLAASHTTR